jgi:hypothetical protein
MKPQKKPRKRQIRLERVYRYSADWYKDHASRATPNQRIDLVGDRLDPVIALILSVAQARELDRFGCARDSVALVAELGRLALQKCQGALGDSAVAGATEPLTFENATIPR